MCDSNGDIKPLDQATLGHITNTQEHFASLGQRVLLFAKKVIEVGPLDKEIVRVDHQAWDDLVATENNDLIVVGLAALVDPPRDDTAETVAICRKAGIRFVL